LRRPVAAANIRVAVEIVVVIDSDVVVTTPAAAPTPTSAPHRPHRNTNAKRDRHPRRIISRWRIVNRGIGVHRWPIHDRWIVRRHIHDLRIRLLDNDRALVFDDLGFYLLLLVRFQIACALGLLAHTLHGFHQIALLRQKGVA
jgi:hypothetical protein